MKLFAGDKAHINMFPLNAKTILGAKREATKLFDVDAFNKIEIFQEFENEQILPIAIKYGFKKWQDC